MSTWPVAGDPQTYPVGPIIDGVNEGTPEAHLARGEGIAIDVPAPGGTPLLAIHESGVTASGWMGDAGYATDCEWEQDGHSFRVRYCHMPEAALAVGTQIAEGEQVGVVGSSGKSTGPHLHIPMWQDGERIDPRTYFEGIGGEPSELPTLLAELRINLAGYAAELRAPKAPSKKRRLQIAAELAGYASRLAGSA